MHFPKSLKICAPRKVWVLPSPWSVSLCKVIIFLYMYIICVFWNSALFGINCNTIIIGGPTKESIDGFTKQAMSWIFWVCAQEAPMCMRLSLPELAHVSSMSMFMDLSCAHAREAYTPTTTLGKSASWVLKLETCPLEWEILRYNRIDMWC